MSKWEDEELPTIEEEATDWATRLLPLKNEAMLKTLAELLRDKEIALKALEYCTAAETKNKHHIVLTLYVSYGICSDDVKSNFVDPFSDLALREEEEERDMPTEAKEIVLTELVRKRDVDKAAHTQKAFFPSLLETITFFIVCQKIRAKASTGHKKTTTGRVVVGRLSLGYQHLR